MKRMLLGLFYTFQGLVNFWLGIRELILMHVTTKDVVSPFLWFFLLSCLSVLTVLGLSMKKLWYQLWAGLTSIFSIFFYAILAYLGYHGMIRGYHYYTIWLALGIVIVVLNVVSVSGLHSLAEGRHVRD